MQCSVTMQMETAEKADALIRLMDVQLTRCPGVEYAGGDL